MNYIERIQRSVDFIENHLSEELDLNQVARQAYMSLASYYRLFYGFTGYSAKEYIPQGEDTRGEFHLDLFFPISQEPANKEPVEVDLPPMHAAALPSTDGKELEQAWRFYENR